MFASQTEKINLAKNRAFKIFTDTKEKFEKAIEQAEKYISDNHSELTTLQSEMLTIHEANSQLQTHIHEMKQSVTKINNILGA